MKKLTQSRARLLRSSPRNLRRLSDAEKSKIGKVGKTGKTGGEYYIAKDTTKVTRRTPIITVSSWKDAHLGIPHSKAAKMRKEKRLGYGPRGEHEVAPQSVRTRERLARPQYDRPWEHTYINTRGESHMQDYGDAFDLTQDGIELLRFNHIKIKTYDGPELPRYDNKNARIYPETNLDKILAKLAFMTDEEKAQFESDRRYRVRERLAA